MRIYPAPPVTSDQRPKERNRRDAGGTLRIAECLLLVCLWTGTSVAADLLPAPDLNESEHLKRLVALLGGQFAGPEKLMDLSRGLRIHENATTVNVVNTFSGEGEVVFSSEHEDEAGEKLKVPNLFLIGIPIFKNGTNYRIACRLRFRKVSSAIVWTYDLYRADVAFNDAFSEACEQAADETGLPLFYGAPE